MSETLTNMVPKWFQNLSKIDPGGGLEATWEPPLKQGASKISFLTTLAPFWDQFGFMLSIIFVDFLKWLFDGIGLHLGSQNTPKMRPQRGQNQNLQIVDFSVMYCTLATFSGAENQHFFGVCFLEPHFGMAFGTHFGYFGSLLRSLLETMLVTVWVQFLH